MYVHIYIYICVEIYIYIHVYRDASGYSQVLRVHGFLAEGALQQHATVGEGWPLKANKEV